jgi:hypothetical protein
MAKKLPNIEETISKPIEARMKDLSSNMDRVVDSVATIHKDSIKGIENTVLSSFRSTVKWSERVSHDIKQAAANNIRSLNELTEKQMKESGQLVTETAKEIQARVMQLSNDLLTADAAEARSIKQQLELLKTSAGDLREEESGRITQLIDTASMNLKDSGSYGSVLKEAIGKTLPSKAEFAEKMLGGGILGKFAGNLIKAKQESKAKSEAMKVHIEAAKQRDDHLKETHDGQFAMLAQLKQMNDRGKDSALLEEERLAEEARKEEEGVTVNVEGGEGEKEEGGGWLQGVLGFLGLFGRRGRIAQFLKRLVPKFFKNALRKVFGKGGFIRSMFTKVFGKGGFLRGLFSKIFSPIGGFIAGLATGAWNAIKGVATSSWNAIKGVATSSWNAIKGVATTVWNSIGDFAKGVWSSLKGVGTGIWNGIKGVADTVWGGIKGTAIGVWDTVATKASGVWDNIAGFASSAFGKMSGIFGSVFRGVSAGLGAVVSTMSDVATGALNKLGIKTAGSKVPKSKGFWGSVWGGIKSAGKAVGGAVAGAGKAVYSAGKATVKAVGSAAKAVYKAGKFVVTTAAKKILGPAIKAVKPVAGKILKGAVKIPVVGAAIEGLFAHGDIQQIVHDKTLTAKQKKQAIGRRMAEALGGVVGGALGFALPQVLNVVPGLGFVVGILGSIFGDMAGRWLGGKMADWMGAETIGGIMGDIYGVDWAQSDKDAAAHQAGTGEPGQMPGPSQPTIPRAGGAALDALKGTQGRNNTPPPRNMGRSRPTSASTTVLDSQNRRKQNLRSEGRVQMNNNSNSSVTAVSNNNVSSNQTFNMSENARNTDSTIRNNDNFNRPRG